MPFWQATYRCAILVRKVWKVNDGVCPRHHACKFTLPISGTILRHMKSILKPNILSSTIQCSFPSIHTY